MSDLTNSNAINNLWGLDDAPQPGAKNNIPAFFNLEDVSDDEEVEKWLGTTIEVLKSQNVSFVNRAVENLMFYKGRYLDSHGRYYSFEDAHRDYSDNKINFNIVYEFVELWVNRVASFKADLTVTPTTNDVTARDNAEAKELALKDYFHKHKIEELTNTFIRHTFQFGEGYLFAYFDQDKGPLHPEWDRIKERYKQLKRVATASGEEVSISRKPRIGEVQVEVIPPIYVLFEDRPWEDLDYLIIEKKEDVNKLRSDHPDIDISGDENHDISVYYMYHLPTKYLPDGRYVKFADGKVLFNDVFPYEKPIFPVVRMTNIDITGSARARSFVENIKSHQILINETATAIWNNVRRSLKGKWVFPAKTVNPRSLAPKSPGIEYFGGVAPQFIQYPSLKQENLTFMAVVREEAEKQARIQGIIQGTPPPNVRSGLQFAQLEEQEKRSVEITISKKNKAVEQLGEIISLIMAKEYQPEDGRMITTFGKDKEYLTQALKVDAIKEDHAVQVRASDFSFAGKASEFAFYSDLRNNFGNQVVPDEFMIDMLDSGRFNQYTEYFGATVETTLAQISQMISGEEPEAPGEHEDLILKWKIVVGTMRKRAYLSYSKEVKQLFEDMVYAIEDLLINKENKTQALEQLTQQLKSFPIFYKPPVLQFPENAVAPIQPPQLGAEQLAGGGASMEGDMPAQNEEEMPAEDMAGL